MLITKKTDKRRFLGYLDRLYGYAFSLTRQRERACDLVQSCIVRVLSAKRVPEDEPAYRAWLFRILRNLYRDELRKERTGPVSLEQQVLDGRDEFLEPLAMTHDDHLFDELVIDEVLDTLSREHCEILILIDMLGYSYREAAELLNVPVGTVMSRISRARRVMLDRIEDSSPVMRRVDTMDES